MSGGSSTSVRFAPTSSTAPASRVALRAPTRASSRGRSGSSWSSVIKLKRGARELASWKRPFEPRAAGLLCRAGTASAPTTRRRPAARLLAAVRAPSSGWRGGRPRRDAAPVASRSGEVRRARLFELLEQRDAHRLPHDPGGQVTDWPQGGVHHPRHGTSADRDLRAAVREVAGNTAFSGPSLRRGP
jgi:hypothetical protein